MKKPKLHVEHPQPRNIQRADIPPADGYALVVDGHFKTQFADKAAAKKAATDLLAKYPKLQVEIFDAASKSRSPMNCRITAADNHVWWFNQPLRIYQEYEPSGRLKRRRPCP
jgi:hypothetical protein